jgi:tetratricopeptide (TPR) repeat protein
MKMRQGQDSRWRSGPLAALLTAALACACLAAPAAAQLDTGDQVEAYIERNGELLRWAGDLVHETDNVLARDVLRRAADLHRRSENLLQDGRPGEAVLVARRVRDAVWHAVRLARESAGLEERVRLRDERFRDQHQLLAERAREAGDEQALEILRRAEEQARRAFERARQGDYEMAMKLLEQAEDLTRRAARMLADGAGPERLAAELERTRAQLEQARARLGDDADGHRRDLLLDAEEALERADEALAAGHPGRALQMAGLARRLLHRALAGPPPGEGPPDAVAIERLFARFDARAEAVAARVAESGHDEARRRLQDAERQRDRAQAAWEKQRAEAALRHLRAALDLLDRAAELAR